MAGGTANCSGALILKKNLLLLQGVPHFYKRNKRWPEVMTIVRALSNSKRIVLLVQRTPQLLGAQ